MELAWRWTLAFAVARDFGSARDGTAIVVRVSLGHQSGSAHPGVAVVGRDEEAFDSALVRKLEVLVILFCQCRVQGGRQHHAP